MKSSSFLLVILLSLFAAKAEATDVKLVDSGDGIRLNVDGQDYFVKGMNWAYFPIGTNFNFDIWSQPDHFIEDVLKTEMSLLREIGINTIRCYSLVPKKWVEHIYQQYGIYTILNHSFGSYGLTIDGEWMPHTDYSDLRTRKLLISEVESMVEDYRDTEDYESCVMK
ncbi:MAG: hypothetical protein AAGC47_13425 [Bacteroidota bacterium]